MSFASYSKTFAKVCVLIVETYSTFPVFAKPLHHKHSVEVLLATWIRAALLKAAAESECVVTVTPPPPLTDGLQ